MELKQTSQERTVIKFLCSYGGKILPRGTDGMLRYVGGHTRVLAVHPSISFSELMVKLGELCGSSVTLKCPLPNGDLETLISVTSDEDLANIIEIYDEASSSLAHPLKTRAILSPPMSLKKVSPPPSSASSANQSPSRSPHKSSVESLPYSMAYRCICRNCSPSVRYPIAVRYGSPRFLYGGSRFNNYCH
ncbi:PB1 domain protein [Senna tora]|uniref:PB1 domain protein n=1 Tax=Senna tora TaxID=362788 RepID=A0A834SYX0_9FABA|nr:PB1 domain protein [Senna tora]